MSINLDTDVILIQVKAIMAEAAELGCAVEAAADDLATQHSATAQTLEMAEGSLEGATAATGTASDASAPAAAAPAVLATSGEPPSAAGGGGLSPQRRGSAASLSSIEAEHLASGAWLSPAQAESVNSDDDFSSSCATGAADPEHAAIGAAADPAGQPATVPAGLAAPSAVAAASLQPRRNPAPCLAVVPSSRRVSVTATMHARVQVRLP